MTKEIKEAMQLLRKNGYAVDNLWHVSDVMDSYHCTEGLAHSIIDDVLNSDRIVSEINEAIDYEAIDESLKEVEY